MVQVQIKDIPQANSLVKVIQTTIAVSEGACTYQEISVFLQVTERQGRYYRRAAEILGLIKSDGTNNSILTENGKQILHSIHFDANRVDVLKPLIIQLPIINEVMGEFENTPNVTEDEILLKLVEVGGWDANSETAIRRFSTFVKWLKEVGLINGIKEKNKIIYKININLKNSHPPSLKILDPYSDFVSKVQAYLDVPYESNLPLNAKELISELLAISSIDGIDTWMKKDGAEKMARLVLFVSEKEEINACDIFQEKELFKSIEISHERLLIEVDRSLRGLSKNIGQGGAALEGLVIDFCKENNLEWKKNYLFEGLSKNVDFFIPSLKLAIECKYSKTSGTKHAGALKDLREQAKGKAKNNYKLAVLIGGSQFCDDKELRTTLFSLVKDQTLDYIFTPSDLKSLSSEKLIKKVNCDFKKSDVEINIDQESSWTLSFTDYERGLDDSARWLKRFMSLEFLNFKAQLHTWITQTPFAIQCLRLILGWSESQMSSFVKKIFNESSVDWKYLLPRFKDANLLVHQLSVNIQSEEIREIQTFFQQQISHFDFLLTREAALRGSAIKKLNTSKVFVDQCKTNSPFLVINKKETYLLPSGAKIESNFQINQSGKTLNVLCKYYSSSGSVMSDLVKSISELVEDGKAHDWVFIIDGPGWLDRDKDLRRLISLVTSNKLQFYNIENWTKFIKKISNA